MNPGPVTDPMSRASVSECSLRRPNALFIGKTYAGWQTRLMNLRANLEADDRLASTFVEVTGWRTGGLLERLEFLPRSVRGRARATAEAAAIARIPRPDVVWSSAVEVLFPYLWLQRTPIRRPLVLEVDWTVSQQEAMAREYFGRLPRRGRALAMAMWRERSIFEAAAAVVCMSHWAADSVIAQGIDPDRVKVIHPGVDLKWWAPPSAARRADGPMRILFVGGDFIRKGGPALIEALSGCGVDHVLDVVTRQPVSCTERVRVHRLEPNTPALRDLYQQADLFVLPTGADCFGHAAVEAMASGTPVVMTNVGGASDIVSTGETGWLLDSIDDLKPLLRAVLTDRHRLHKMGAAARRRAETRFDGRHNDEKLADLLLSVSLPRPRLSHRGGSVRTHRPSTSQ